MIEKENKKRKRHFDRVTLDEATLERLDTWIKQVEAVKPGVSLARKDVLNWMIKSLPERLTGAQEKVLADTFYSELRYIQFAAREIKAAAARGERLTLKDLENRSPRPITPRRRSGKKETSGGVPDFPGDPPSTKHAPT
ncbi:MAG: hypothetical protein AB7G93_00970 [Bdellovibrionales bacterium]